jgi:hypothetical protein
LQLLDDEFLIAHRAGLGDSIDISRLLVQSKQLHKLPIAYTLPRYSRSLPAMLWQVLALVALRAQDVSAQGKLGSSDFIRFGCSQLVVERTDPLVNPGLNPSPHMHQASILTEWLLVALNVANAIKVVGGDSFNVTVCSSPLWRIFRSVVD